MLSVMAGHGRAEVLGIGYLARLSGLSVGALRHYDSEGLLRPAIVDPATGYRRYLRDQLEAARLVAALRDLELGLDDVRAYLAANAGGRRLLVTKHRAHLRARLHVLQRIEHALIHLIDATLEGDPMTQIVDDTLDPATETALAKRLYNGVWAVLEKPDRSPEDADALINMAHASRYHWGNVGTPQHVAIGEWQIARVYSELGRGEPAVFHARRALAIADGAEVDSWLTASAYEGLARAYAVAGDRAVASEWKTKAVAALDAVSDSEDRETVQRDIDTLPL